MATSKAATVCSELDETIKDKLKDGFLFLTPRMTILMGNLMDLTNKENMDIAKRCKELGIIYFSGAETAVKEDVLTALNAIEANMNVTSDEEMYNRIKELQNAKNTGI